jgi:hypothetical protein
MNTPVTSAIEQMMEGPPTLGQLVAAIEGFRNQLEIFATTALAEIDLMKYWIQQIDPNANCGVELPKP